MVVAMVVVMPATSSFDTLGRLPIAANAHTTKATDLRKAKMWF
jgi:hypothetical protein